LILRTLSAKNPVNAPGSLPDRLPGGLPEGMPAPLRGFTAASGQGRLILPPSERGPNVREQAAHYGPLGPPMDIRQAAAVIGCSPWTVRQKLIPMGLPCFRSGASGKLIFYLDQVVRWIETKQKED
jgi:hypothetical protein